MDYNPWNHEKRLSFERTSDSNGSLTLASTSPPSSNLQTSLPPLHQAIPEFHSHNPCERRSSSVPRKLADRESPSSFRPLHRVSPDPGQSSSPRSVFLPKPGFDPIESARNVSAETSDAAPYDAQTYLFPAHIESPRPAGTNASPSRAQDSRHGAYLPPVSSLTSSRGSSFDSDRPPSNTAPLPLLYHSHQPHGSFRGTGGACGENRREGGAREGQYDPELVRSHQSTPDYHRYSTGTPRSPKSYRPTSPMTQYPQQQYPFASSYSQTQSQSLPYLRGPQQPDRSPFSAPINPSELNMDHFEQSRPGKRRRGNLPKQTTDLLRSWLQDHIHHPYPTEEEKQMLMNQTGLTIHQISNWFINARRRRLPVLTTHHNQHHHHHHHHTHGGGDLGRGTGGHHSDPKIIHSNRRSSSGQ